MIKRVISALVLVAALAGSTLAGDRSHERFPSCAMTCCHEASGLEQSPAASAARLCCVLYCQQPGTTRPYGVSPNSLPQAVIVHPAVKHQQENFSGRFEPTLFHRQDSPPKYIQHLALLI